MLIFITVISAATPVFINSLDITYQGKLRESYIRNVFVNSLVGYDVDYHFDPHPVVVNKLLVQKATGERFPDVSCNVLSI